MRLNVLMLEAANGARVLTEEQDFGGRCVRQ